MSKPKNYESLVKRLHKIQALAERGDRGERESARQMLADLCRKYGLTPESFSDTEKRVYEFEIGRAPELVTLFVQCYSKVCQVNRIDCSQVSRNRVRVSLTAVQRAELLELFEWHKSNFREELKEMKETIIRAYIGKHRIFSDQSLENPDPEPVDMQRVWKILQMQSVLSDRKFTKLIGKEVQP